VAWTPSKLFAHLLDVRFGVRNTVRTALGQGLHSMAMEPEQSDGKLPKVVSIRSDWQLPRTTQRIGSLTFQR
jgi:hypothetical protein